MKSLLLFSRFILIILTLSATLTLSAKRVTITVSNYVFTPNAVTDVEIGDSIIWQWENGSHTTTSTSVPAGAAEWDSPINQSNPVYIYVPTVAGVYNYVCTPHASMGMTGTFTVKSASGINDRSAVAPVIRLFPNPFSDVLSFRYDTKGDNLAKVEIYDLTGKKVFEKTEGLKSGVDTMVDLNSLTPGVYLVKFTDSSNNSWARRVNKE